MSDISKITVGENTYDIKDSEARSGLSNKQNTLTAGSNITIVNDVISATGGGSGTTEVFVAVYGTTSYDDVEAAYQAGKQVFVQRDASSTNAYYYSLARRYTSGSYVYYQFQGFGTYTGTYYTTSAVGFSMVTINSNTKTWGNSLFTSVPANVGLNSAAQHNGYYRDGNLGAITSESSCATLLSAIGVTDGTYKNVYPGDYVTISDGTFNRKWIVVRVGSDKTGDSSSLSNCIALMPLTSLPSTAMNSSATTSGGYLGTSVHTYLNDTVATALKTALGSHLLSKRLRLSSTVSTSTASMAGAGLSGATTACTWTSCYAALPTEQQLFGTNSVVSSYLDSGEATEKLPIFNFVSPCSLWPSNFWLRNVVSSSQFAYYSYAGFINVGSASTSYGLVPIIYIG